MSKLKQEKSLLHTIKAGLRTRLDSLSLSKDGSSNKGADIDPRWRSDGGFEAERATMRLSDDKAESAMVDKKFEKKYAL